MLLRDSFSRAILTRSEGCMTTEGVREQVSKYLARARQAIAAGELALAHDDYVTAVNRAYYATFYSANALLSTKGLERSKHSGVLAAFRQHFVKTGLIETEYSDIYGAVMEDRAEGDYNLEFETDADQAERDMARAQRFLARAEHALQEMGVLP
jgi:uncharacterized protein (UPF0332 family)